MRMKHLLPLMIACAFCSLSAGRAVPSDPANAEQKRLDAFRKADANHDGRISWDEFRVAVRAILARRDDFESRGFATLPLSIQDALLRDHFDKMDIRHVGFLTYDEWKEEK